MATLFMPMMHSPFCILEIRLVGDVNPEHMPSRKGGGALQDEIENDNDGVDTDHAERVEDVELRLQSSLGRASNNILASVNSLIPGKVPGSHSQLSLPKTGRWPARSCISQACCRRGSTGPEKRVSDGLTIFSKQVSIQLAADTRQGDPNDLPWS